MKTHLLIAFLLFPFLANANLVVKVAEPKTTGSKSVVKLELKNTFSQKIESARAVLFLLDDQGKVIGQSTKWVLGGGKKDSPTLAPNSSTTFNFVVSAEKPFSKTKLMFTRIILEGGKLADPIKDVELGIIQGGTK